MKKHESGRSMIEMVGVLAVMGLITAGAFVLMRSGMASQKRNRVQDEVANIATNIRTLSASLDDFSNLPKPDDFEKGGVEFLDNLEIQTTTPLGGDTRYSVTADKKQFTVYILNPSRKECYALEQVGWSEGTAQCLFDKNKAFTITYGK